MKLTKGYFMVDNKIIGAIKDFEFEMDNNLHPQYKNRMTYNFHVGNKTYSVNLILEHNWFKRLIIFFKKWKLK